MANLKKVTDLYEDNHVLPGKIINIECRDIDIKGRGIAIWNRHVLVIPTLVPGDKAKVEILFRKGSQWICRVNLLFNQSKLRNEPLCRVFPLCGGCSIQHIKYDAQLALKISNLKEMLKRIANVDINEFKFLYDKNSFYGYRNRTILPIERTDKGKINLGYFKRSSHEIVDINSCPILDKDIDEILVKIKSDIENVDLNASPDGYNKGLRHISIRKSHHKRNILITLISSTLKLNGLYTLANGWLTNLNNVVGVTINIQSKPTNKIYGDKTFTLAGRSTIEDYFCGLRIFSSSTTFYQVNTPLAEQITDIIISYFKACSCIDRAIDAYCGVGTISLSIAQVGIPTIGIEYSKESINLAKLNTYINDIRNIKFICNYVDCIIYKYLTRSTGLVLDPPRKGLSNKLINIILATKPRIIAYLSCNISTLCRDIQILVYINKQYKIKSIYPVDFFPHTTHLECLVILESLNF